MRNLFKNLTSLLLRHRDETEKPKTPNSRETKNNLGTNPIWLEPGSPQNPFPYPVLDCRAVALGLTSTTSDPAIANKFLDLRTDDGRSHIGSLPDHLFTIHCDLRFPYNGQREEGVIFIAKEMEDKWDLCVYDSRFYIRRSWTGMLLHVAELQYTDTEVVISIIHSNGELMHRHAAYTTEHVQFLIMAHLGGQKRSFPIPPDTDMNELTQIALSGFSNYGRRAQFAHLLQDLETIAPKPLPHLRSGDCPSDHV